MSSPVTPPPTFTPALPTSSAATLLLPSPPPELASYPVGTVFPAVLLPPETSADMATVVLTLPDGREISFPAKMSAPPASETQAFLKIMPSEIKGTLSLHLQFHTPAAPAVPKIMPEIPPAAPLETPSVRETVAGASAPFEAYVLKNIPPALLEALPQAAVEMPLAAGTKLTVRIIPEIQSGMPSSAPVPPSSVLPEKTENPAGNATQPVPPAPRTTPQPPLGAGEILPPPEGIKPETVPFGKDLPLPAAAKSEILSETFSPRLPVSPTDVKVQGVLLKTESEIFKTAADILKTADNVSRSGATFVPPLLAAQAKSAKAALHLTVPPLSRVPVTDEPTVPTGKPTAEPPPRPPLLRPNTFLPGTVWQARPEEPMMVATKVGVLAVDAKILLPPLTPVSLQITDIQPPGATLIEKDPLPSFRTSWTILAHALETLEQTDAAAAEAVKRILPQAGNRLPALMMSYVQAAVQGQSFASWLGEANVAALRKTGTKGENILRRLEKEFSASGKKATDGRTSWRGWDIPLLSGNVVEPVSLFLQQPPEESAHSRSAGTAGKSGVRFVLDMNLTRLGRMQMEGLAYRDRRIFDLTLRHAEAMPDVFEPTVRSLFSRTLDALNYAGTLRVNRTDEFLDFRPEDEAGTETKRGVLV